MSRRERCRQTQQEGGQRGPASRRAGGPIIGQACDVERGEDRVAAVARARKRRAGRRPRGHLVADDHAAGVIVNVRPGEKLRPRDAHSSPFAANGSGIVIRCQGSWLPTASTGGVMSPMPALDATTLAAWPRRRRVVEQIHESVVAFRIAHEQALIQNDIDRDLPGFLDHEFRPRLPRHGGRVVDELRVGCRLVPI
jgi:hypothetical protein